MSQAVCNQVILKGIQAHAAYLCSQFYLGTCHSLHLLMSVQPVWKECGGVRTVPRICSGLFRMKLWGWGWGGGGGGG